MIRYIQHSEIDKTQWDKCISKSPNGLVYAYSWYLDIVSPHWDALVEEDYQNVFPLTFRKKFGFHYLFQPPFTQQLGLFSHENSSGEKRLEKFLNAIPDKFRLVEIQLNTFNSLIDSEEFKIYPKLTTHLSLSDSKEKIYAGYSTGLKRNIKKALKNSLSVEKNISPKAVIDLFRKNRGRKIDTLKDNDFSKLEQLFSPLAAHSLLDCRGIKNSDQQLIAGALFLKSNNSYIFYFSATSALAKETGAMSIIIDSFISDHVHENKILDFEGSMNPTLARFYKSFGSQEVVYLQIRRNTLPLIIRWLK